MRLLGAALAATLLLASLMPGPASASPLVGRLYFDATVLADRTGECQANRDYVMKPTAPANSANAYMDPQPGTSGCSARFKLYETEPFLVPKSDVSFTIYVACSDPLGLVSPGGDPSLSALVHLFNATGAEQGDSPVQTTSLPLVGCGTGGSSCSSPQDATLLAGVFHDVEMTGSDSEHMVLQVDAVTFGASGEFLGDIYIMTGPVPCNYSTLPAPDNMSSISGRFLPGGGEDLYLTTDLVYGKGAPDGTVTFPLALHNNASLTGFAFSTEGLPHAFGTTFLPLSGPIDANETLRVNLEVTVPRLAPVGSLWPFTIRVDGDHGTNATVQVEIKVISGPPTPPPVGPPVVNPPPPPPVVPPVVNPPPPPPDDTEPPGVTSAPKKTPGLELPLLLAGLAALLVLRRRRA